MKNRKRYCVAAACLGLSLLLSACGGGAKSMRLRKTEGTVRVNNARDKELKTKENQKLYSGYGVRTKLDSYAWVDLDSVKLTKLDQDSRVEIVKDGKNLTIELISGNLFFNVTEPLADDESMDIRTATMAIGIRGTCGWVEVSEDEDTAWVYLLQGKVECTTEDESIRVRAGEMATITEDGELVVEEFDVSAIPDFVQSEADENKDVDKMLQKLPGQGKKTTSKGSGSEPNPYGPGIAIPEQGGLDLLLEPGVGSDEPPAAVGVPAAGFTPWASAGVADHDMVWQDTALEQAMRDVTGIRDRAIRLSDVWELKELNLYGKGISNITALWELVNLENLNLQNNNVSEVIWLSGLTNLKHLVLHNNQCSDISPLIGLTNMEYLDLCNNNISDVSALGNMKALQTLYLMSDPVADYTPVSFVPNLYK